MLPASLVFYLVCVLFLVFVIIMSKIGFLVIFFKMRLLLCKPVNTPHYQATSCNYNTQRKNLHVLQYPEDDVCTLKRVEIKT